MTEKILKPTYVIGHKNPDTDSICSAIAYARLKEKMTGGVYIPCRAGFVNPETEYVLERFHHPAPKLVESIQTQVRDIDLRETKGVRGDISLKKAWDLMREENRVTLAVTSEDRTLEGLITVSDIANSYMTVYGSDILAKAETPYRNIVEALDGEMVVGDPDACFSNGKVLVAAANMDMLENFIEENDMILVGNRYDCQVCAVEMNAACLIICAGAPVSEVIKRVALRNHCAIITTPLDTYTATRFVHQSMPIRFMMTKGNVSAFHMNDYTDKVKEVMQTKKHRYFPVLDDEGKFYSLISRRNFLGMSGKKVILVDHNEKSQAVDGVESADVLEIIDHHRLGNLETINPVFFRNQPVGCTATIVYQIYREKGIEIDADIAGLLCAAIISDTLLFRSPTCTPADMLAAQDLAKICDVDLEQLAQEMFSAGSNLTGKSDEEIFYQDYKVFTVDNKKVGIGQISSVLRDELEEMKPRMSAFLKKNHKKSGMDYCYLMMTSILDESSDVLCDSEGAADLLEEAFAGVTADGLSVVLPGVVSRKKQFGPMLMGSMKE
ncbi:MAG: putative manganese-dependent inorganic diphosphatase [Lachnospiraceae bacterium]|nr:putative manganese-dependent inorganic diphosphatase [Lachnospiraceae bacterium]